MQTQTNTLTQTQIAAEVARSLSAAITAGATAESLAAVDESWHADVEDAVDALNDFYDRETNGQPHLLRDVLFLNTDTGAVWVRRLSGNEQFADETNTNGPIARLAERDGELPWLRMYGPGADLEFPDSADEFRAIFADEIADALVTQL